MSTTPPTPAAEPGNGRAWLAALLALTLMTGLAYSLAVPLWQAPDEPGHFEQAALLAQQGWPLRRSAQDAALEQAIIASLARQRFWHWVGEPWPQPLPASFAADPFLARSGRQVGDEPPAYYLPLALLLRLAPDMDAQARLARGYSLALLVLTAAVAWGAAREAFPNDPFLAPATAALVGLLPTAAFMGGAVNNDIAAALLGAAYAWALVRWCGSDRPSLRSALPLAALALLGLLVKKTLAFTLPLTALIFLTAWWRRPRRLLRPAAALAGLALAVAVWWHLPGPEPAAWLDGALPGAAGRTPAAALSGSHGLQVVDRSPLAAPRLVQSLARNAAASLAGQEVAVKAWVRSPAGQQAGRLVLLTDDGNHRLSFVADERWRQVTLERRLPPETTFVRLALGAGAGEEVGEQGVLYADDVELWAGGRQWLINGGGEERAAWGPSAARRLAAYGQAARLLLGPGTTRKLGRWLDWLAALPTVLRSGGVPWPQMALYTLLTFASFWGNFGWLQVPLSPALYAALALFTLGGALGWVRWQRRPSAGAEALQRRIGRWLALALGLALAQVAIPMVVQTWQPQGRYLLPALFPAAACLALGWRAWLPAGWVRWAAWAWVAALALLNGVCLWGYVLPAFRG
ncbi:MAG: DUF2142 domain-containing protein [Chloroflexi bacterium]|nr:DUF2142 domain-containing protein [Chloroflexota bacterium]